MNETDIHCIFGMRESGKSYLTAKLADTHARVIVFDRLKEWHTIRPDCIADSYSSFARIFHALHTHDSYRISVQFRRGVSEDELTQETESILRLIYDYGFARNRNHDPYPVTLVFEELQFYCNPHGIPPMLSEILFTGRHAKIGIIANTQRPANIHKGFVSQANHLYVGRLFEKRDIEYLTQSSFGTDALQAINLKQFHFLHKAYGQPTRLVTPT